MNSDFAEERLELVRARLRRYREAENAVLSSQSYSVEGLRLTRADLGKIQAMIGELEREEMKLMREFGNNKRSRIRYVIPRDEVRIR